MFGKLRYRLALDLGSTSLGWAMVRLDKQGNPCAVIKAGVRIFSDGRNPKDGSSLAVTRRAARAMRRRRDRLLKRKQRMMDALVNHGFFPADEAERKALETLNPYALRAKGLDDQLTPAEFARALFHINQRRGFKSNRKTDKKENDSGALKSAIKKLHELLQTENCRTVGEWLNKRNKAKQTVRARYHQDKTIKEDGKTKIEKYYDLYIDRAMIEHEFDELWKKQAELNPSQFNDLVRSELKDILLHQRPLKPVKPGRCTFLPDEERAPLALPSTQRFRMYQEVNNLRILREGLKEETLTLEQRDTLITSLEKSSKCSFTKVKELLGLSGAVQFNFEDPKRQELKGNTTSAILSKDDLFGPAWFKVDEAKQDAIVMKLLTEESEDTLVRWLQSETGVDEKTAEAIANVALPEGYGSLCAKALARILPELRRNVLTYDKAVQAAGFTHHSKLEQNAEIPGVTFKAECIDQKTGEIKPFHIHHTLPYYGEYLQRHVGFGSGKPDDTPEKRYGKIANPTVHIGLNQVKLVVNALIKRYGHPSEVIVEVARELKQSYEQRKEENKRQAANQERNKRMRSDIAGILKISVEQVSRDDIEKMILWEELSHDVADRKCPYSGVPISAAMLFNAEVEIEHILPFSQTLDDSLNNKTVSMRQANRIKGNRTPWEAMQDFEAQGWKYEDILARAGKMKKEKRYRFAEDGYQRWLKEDKGFLARALNDTHYLSKVAREYLTLICPQDTRVIPGRMTAMLRGKFGLNDVLGLNGEKNRNDHRHHAVDACVIAVTDQGLLQRFAKANASAREKQLNRLVESMPQPWDSYREHVQRAVGNIWISHRPDHGYEAGFADDTAYRPPHLDPLGKWRTRGIGGTKPNERDINAALIAVTEPHQVTRHGVDEAGNPLPYKGYMGGDNYSFEITRTDDNKWEGNVITTYHAYRIASDGGLKQLRNPTQGQNGMPLIMRLVAGDSIACDVSGARVIFKVIKMRARGNKVSLIGLNEANHARRTNARDNTLIALLDQSASSLKRLRARRVTISPIGELHDPGFKE